MAAWNELGLFHRLAEGPLTPEELPADTRAVETTAPVLKHLGLLNGEEERLILSRVGRQLLDNAQLPTARNFEFLQDQAKMQELLAGGGPVRTDQGDKGTDGGTRADDPEQTARFLDMLYQRSRESARQVRDWLAPLLPSGAAILDLGGGHGRYARSFADAGYQAALFDFPYVIDYARHRHGDALTYLDGDFREPDADLGGPYDLILLSNVVHGEPDEVNAELMKRLASVLENGGCVVLKDMFLDEFERDPEEAVFFGVTMLLYTGSGRSHTLERARSWLTNAGLCDPRVAVFEAYQLLHARKAL